MNGGSWREGKEMEERARERKNVMMVGMEEEVRLRMESEMKGERKRLRRAEVGCAGGGKVGCSKREDERGGLLQMSG